MRTKIEKQNAQKIEAELARVNGKATSFTITSFSEIAAAAEKAEEKLAAEGLPAALRKGATISYKPAGPQANSYGSAAITTRVKLERGATGWFIVAVERDKVFPGAAARSDITLTEEHIAQIMQRVRKRYTIAKAA